MRVKNTLLVLGILSLGLFVATRNADAEPDGESRAPGSELAPGSFGYPMDDLSDLETKRRVDAIKADFPKQQAAFKQLCGSDVSIDVDWGSFGHDKGALTLIGTNMGIERLVTAFQGPCHDQAGKDAVKAKVKTIRAVNVKDPSQIKASVSGGVFIAQLNWSGTSPGMNETDLGQIITKSL
jgi:hypothetical protein